MKFFCNLNNSQIVEIRTKVLYHSQASLIPDLSLGL